MRLWPNHCLVMKTYAIPLTPGTFSKPDIYSRRGKRRIQHIASIFWTRWKKEFLKSLRVSQKWKNWKQIFKVGEVVLLRQDSFRNKLPKTRILETRPDTTTVVCSMKLELGDASIDFQKVLRRPISKIVLLAENELVRLPNKGKNWWGFAKKLSWGKPDEKYIEKLRNRTVYSGTAKRILIYGVIELVCKCDLFNYTGIKLVTYTNCVCSNRSCAQYVCEKYKKNQ